MIGKPSKRPRQVAELIHHELAMILRKDIGDPLFVHLTIREVDLSNDLSNAKIYVALYNDEQKDEVMKRLEQWLPKIRHYLSKKVMLRYVPKLNFIYDETQQRAARIDDLLKDED